MGRGTHYRHLARGNSFVFYYSTLLAPNSLSLLTLTCLTGPRNYSVYSQILVFYMLSVSGTFYSQHFPTINNNSLYGSVTCRKVSYSSWSHSGSLWSFLSDKLQELWPLWINYIQNKKEARHLAIQRRLESVGAKPGVFATEELYAWKQQYGSETYLLNNSSLPYTLLRPYSYL